MTPLNRQIVVPVPPATAFTTFTDRIGDWWPVARHSVHGEGAKPAFQDGRLIETGPGGEQEVWGTVLDWQPPRSFRMTWHPGRDETNASTVEVSFAPVGDAATLVTVTHSGWHELAVRNEYRSGWPTVLSRLAEHLPGLPDAEGEVVLVLTHTPAPGVADPFAHPGFGKHAEFLQSLRDQGVLVAAGPFPASGEGMTIVRLSGPAAAASCVRDAHYTDGAVTDGVLEVRVRPWVVMMSGSPLF